MRILEIANPNIERTQFTWLDADYSSGDITLTARSNTSFQANDYVVVDTPGSERAEIKRLTGITGTQTLNLASALNFTHQKGAPIYLTPWDTVEISRMASGGSWAVISQSAIQWDKENTVYVDNDGVSTDSYRWRFQHTARGLNSEYSPTVTGAGFSRDQAGYMIARVRSIIGDKERRKVSNSEILRFLNKAQDIIYGIRADWWFLKVDTFRDSNGISATASTHTYALSTYSDLAYVDRVKYRFNDGTNDTVYDLEYLTPVLFDTKVKDNATDETNEDDYAESYTLLPATSSSAQGYIRIYPTTDNNSRGTIYPIYYKKMSDLSGVASETDIPIPSVLEDFAIAMCYRIMGNTTKAEIYEALFYGPGSEQRTRNELSGIALLEQLHANSGKAVGQPKAIWSFKGRGAMRRMFGDREVDRDALAERYFN